MAEVYRAMIQRPGRNWEPLNLKLYLNVEDAQRAIEHHQRNSTFFRWHDKFKIQQADISDEMFYDREETDAVR